MMSASPATPLQPDGPVHGLPGHSSWSKDVCEILEVVRFAELQPTNGCAASSRGGQIAQASSPDAEEHGAEASMLLLSADTEPAP